MKLVLISPIEKQVFVFVEVERLLGPKRKTRLDQVPPYADAPVL